MQGDIFELEGLQNPVAAKHVTFQTNPNPPTKAPELAPATLIYNEDDLSHLLHEPESSVHDHHVEIRGYNSDALTHAHYLGLIASAFDDYCTDDVPDFTDDSAACSDDEYDVLTPSSEEAPVVSSKRVPANTTQAAPQEKEKTIAETQHVSAIEGQCMSWWPMPVEKKEYEGGAETTYEVESAQNASQKATTRQVKNVVPEHHHVSNIEGHLMSWWPMSTEALQNDWNERFYE